MRTKTIMVFLLAVLLLPGIAGGADGTPILEADGMLVSQATPEGGGGFSRILRFAAGSFAGAGAPFLWAILMVSAFATTLVVEKAHFLFLRSSSGDTHAFEQIIRSIKDRRIEEARAVADKCRTPFGRIARTVLGVRHGHRSEDLQNLLDEAYLREIPIFQRRLPLIAMSANIATLLGLLGTIVGLIMAFDAVANVPAAQRTAALAAGISVAMATTGFGLIVAIPSLAAHGILGARADRAVEEIESRLAMLTNQIQDWNRKPQTDTFDSAKTGIEERGERLVDFVAAGDIQ